MSQQVKIQYGRTIKLPLPLAKFPIRASHVENGAVADRSNATIRHKLYELHLRPEFSDDFCAGVLDALGHSIPSLCTALNGDETKTVKFRQQLCNLVHDDLDEADVFWFFRRLEVGRGRIVISVVFGDSDQVDYIIALMQKVWS